MYRCKYICILMYIPLYIYIPEEWHEKSQPQIGYVKNMFSKTHNYIVLTMTDNRRVQFSNDERTECTGIKIKYQRLPDEAALPWGVPCISKKTEAEPEDDEEEDGADRPADVADAEAPVDKHPVHMAESVESNDAIPKGVQSYRGWKTSWRKDRWI